LDDEEGMVRMKGLWEGTVKESGRSVETGCYAKGKIAFYPSEQNHLISTPEKNAVASSQVAGFLS
jgi:hypothetical protein